jgi:hypothetical protein
MDVDRFDRLARILSSHGSRRTLFSVLTGGLLTTLSLTGDYTRAKNKKHKKKKKRKPAVPTSPLVPLAPPASPPPPLPPPSSPPSPPPPPPVKVLAPFTVEAAWDTASDHDTFLFVPAPPGVEVEHAYINYFCNSDETENGTVYPFAFVSEDAGGGGGQNAEVTTVRALLSGTYEYWIEVEAKVPAADLTVTLRNFGGHIVRAWTSPANDSIDQLGWHVFDIAGPSGVLTSVDHLRTEGLPELYEDNGYVCPD